MSGTHSHSVAYVRETMLPEAEPPASETGAIKWLRENLFSSWFNAILTVLSVLFIYFVLSHILPWMVGGIWNAGSLSECREIRNATLGEDAHVACWAVLVERWPQLLFGFYPSELYWRPILALAVFAVGIAPILFTDLPRRLLLVSLATPFVCYWLLWGGSVWGPVTVALGLGLTAVALSRVADARGLLWGGLAALAVFLLLFLDPVASLAGLVDGILRGVAGLFGAGAPPPVDGEAVARFAPLSNAWAGLERALGGTIFPLVPMLASLLGTALPLAIEYVPSDDFGGFMLAVIIGLSGIILSLPLGVLLALGRQSDMFLINKVSVVFIEVIRGVPLIAWLFTASLLLNYFLPPGTNFDLMLRVIIMVTLFSAAYIAEVVRGGLAALPRGQYEGGDSLGLDYAQSMRLIILPQALKISIPGIVNTFIGLFKDTTLVVFIGLLDPIGLSNAIRASTEWNGIYWELFIFIGLLFFVFCFGMSRYSMYLERKLRTDHR